MNSQERLQIYLTESLKKVTDGKYRRVSEALIEVLPDFVRSLHQTILDKESTRSERASSLSMLNSLIHRMELASRPTPKKYKPRVAEPLTAEQFADKLLHASPETLEKHFKQMLVVAENWKRKYNGE